MKERYNDAVERIREIPSENTVQDPFRQFFCTAAERILVLDRWNRRFENEDLVYTKDIFDLQEMHRELYMPLQRENNAKSWLNPDYAAVLGKYGAVLSALLYEISAMLPAVYEKRQSSITAILELFVQFYCLFASAAEDGVLPRKQAVRDVLYSYFYDYSEGMQREMLSAEYCPESSLLKRVALEGDLQNPMYLYRCGEYVSPLMQEETERVLALPEDTLRKQAEEICGRLLEVPSSKCSAGGAFVRILADPEQFRLVRIFAEKLRAAGCDFTLPRRIRQLLTSDPAEMERSARMDAGRMPDPQLIYDHAWDIALIMGDRLSGRILEERRLLLCEIRRKNNSRFLGTIDLRTAAAPPENSELTEKPGRLHFNAHQTAVYEALRKELSEMMPAEDKHE